MTCLLCKEPDIESLDFETGNNAEYCVSVPLCQFHFNEADHTGYDFEEKYAEQILECLYDHQRRHADTLRDEAKYL